MTDSITVRACRADDVGGVLRIWEDSRSEHASSADRRTDLERLLQEFPESVLVAEEDGILAGVVIAAWDGWRGNIYRLAVRAESRRRGIASRLVAAAEAQLRSRDCRRVTALVAHEDEVAGGFWDAAGFPRDTEIGRRVKDL